MLFNNLAQNFLRRIRNTHFTLSTRTNTRKYTQTTVESEGGGGGGGTIFCLDEMVLRGKVRKYMELVLFFSLFMMC